MPWQVLSSSNELRSTYLVKPKAHGTYVGTLVGPIIEFLQRVLCPTVNMVLPRILTVAQTAAAWISQCTWTPKPAPSIKFQVPPNHGHKVSCRVWEVCKIVACWALSVGVGLSCCILLGSGYFLFGPVFWLLSEDSSIKHKQRARIPTYPTKANYIARSR